MYTLKEKGRTLDGHAVKGNWISQLNTKQYVALLILEGKYSEEVLNAAFPEVKAHELRDELRALGALTTEQLAVEYLMSPSRPLPRRPVIPERRRVEEEGGDSHE